MNKQSLSRRTVTMSLITTALSVVLGGFSAQAAALKVVATTSLVADLVQSIGGDRVAVTSLMGPGVDPHLYKPTAGDIIKLTRAEVIFYHGMALEGKMGDLFARLSRQGRSIHAITQNLPPEEWIVPEESPQHPDPHVWGDPRLWKTCALKVQQVLVQLDPEGKELYLAANQQYAQRLEEWIAWGKALMDRIEPSKRILITSHDAFNYFGRAFGLKVVGVQGISTASEAPLADIIHVVDLIREQSIPAIFVESSVSPAIIRRISEDAGVQVGGELFSDALGASGEKGSFESRSWDLGTYAGWLGHNVSTISQAMVPSDAP